MRFQSPYAEGERVCVQFRKGIGIGAEECTASLVTAPAARGMQGGGAVVAKEPLRISLQQVRPLLFRHFGRKRGMRIREEQAHAVDEPVDLRLRAKKYPAQDEACAPPRMLLSIG